MRGKAALVVGLAAGYVLGTRDGRARYQQIKTQFNRVVSDPRVQEKTSQAADLAKAKAPVVKDKLSDVTSKATNKATNKATKKATSKVGSDSGSGSDSDLPAQTTITAPDLTHDTSDVSVDTETTSAGSAPDSTVDSDSSADSSIGEDTADEDAIILTPPSPSPLAPGPTDTSSSSPSTGGSHG